MTTYAKIIDKYNIEPAPPVNVTDSGLVVNYNSEANAEQLLADGYLPVTYSEQPAAPWEVAVYTAHAGQIVQTYEAVPLEDYRAQCIAEIQAEAGSRSEAAKTGFSYPEVDTREKQASGARALQADPESATPEAQFVRAIASEIGIPVEALVERILANVKKAGDAEAKIIGIQNRLEMAARAATTHEELAAIAWPETTEEQ
ncbi:hypothetical protein [Akkermansia glycaniphila]|uniref:DUF4376 domain-containing protein n=1 Tax=Akkermansia glycaniphila TaxID=1679444 RepID=A0A1C7P9X7_9BACT|nr:hypothetical protein [Akkermansia glycaniphila]OCA02164.1 hypothetical protein AC781_11425 [Akkermansia glycaniphila]SEH99608.1 Hypothetical protein PYTT_2412 [Akkermansia glycaniphila]